MRSVPRLNVRTQLSLAFLVVVLISWGLNVLVFQYVIEQDRQRFRREMTAQREAAAQREGAARNGGVATAPGTERHGPDGGNGGRSRRSAWRSRAYPKVLPIQATIAVVLSLGAGAWLARHFTRPLSRLEEGAHAFHAHRFQHRIPQLGGDEFARVAASMNEMAERVEGQFAALETDARRRRQLLADVAHELRSPVATLKTMAEAMRDGLASQPERRERALSAMVGTSDRLQRLVSDLMELAKLDLRELPLHIQSVDLANVADQSLIAHSDAAERAGIHLRPLCADGDTIISGDPMRLGEIVDNLLGNAVDHAGREAEVWLEVRGNDQGVTLIVADTGRGIAEEHMPFIFDPFYRADTVRTPGDQHSGLGLRIARALAEAHGGTLLLESTEGHGARATLSLPRPST